MIAHKGILLTVDFDLAVVNKSLQVGDSTDQEAACVLRMFQGECKEDTLLGIGLTRYIRQKYNASQINQRIRLHLTRAGINYDDFKDRININIKTTE
jgi:hypothetical protein